MHIRALVLGCVAALGMLAFAPMAIADPAPDICVLDVSEPITLDHAINTADLTCAALAAVSVAEAAVVVPDDAERSADLCTSSAHATSAPIGYRLHVDPGRCLA